MQMSRSVTIPTRRRCSSTTGTQPQSRSHMICAARESVSWLLQVSTLRVISSSACMRAPWAGTARCVRSKRNAQRSKSRHLPCVVEEQGETADENDQRDAGAADAQQAQLDLV